ncbi:MAG: hypothetical protein WDW38_010047 [Sanguina aurantia]
MQALPDSLPPSTSVTCRTRPRSCWCRGARATAPPKKCAAAKNGRRASVRPRRHPAAVGGSALSMRIANSVGAVLTNRRVLGDSSAGPTLGGALALLVLSVVALVWPASVAWPFAVLFAWFGLNLAIRAWRLRKRQQRNAQPFEEEPATSTRGRRCPARSSQRRLSSGILQPSGRRPLPPTHASLPVPCPLSPLTPPRALS